MYIYIPIKKKSSCVRNLFFTYFTRLAFHMPGFYLLTIFNYFIAVQASGKLLFIYSGNLKLKHQPVTFWVKYYQ